MGDDSSEGRLAKSAGSCDIVLCYPVEDRHLRQIRDAAPNAELVDAGQERIASEILAADVFCGHAKVPIDWQAVVDGGRLRWIQSSAAGLDHCLVPAVVNSSITITSTSGVLADQVAEHAMALALGLTRSLPTFFRAAGEAVRSPSDARHAPSNAGNRRLWRRGAADCRACESAENAKSWRPIGFPSNKPPHVETLWPAERLDEMLPQVDMLFLAAPLTAETRGMIGAKELALLPRGSILINVARGPLVVERDLVAASRVVEISAAGLDVTEEEPLPPASPLWELENVIITPHVGGQSAKRIDQMTDFFCDNLRRYLAGQPLKNLVDIAPGFSAASGVRQRRLTLPIASRRSILARRSQTAPKPQKN